LYKGGRQLPEIAAQLSEHDRLDRAVIGELMGLPGGRNGPVADVADRPASYLATVIVPAQRDDRQRNGHP
jgi:precorrin-2 methylase